MLLAQITRPQASQGPFAGHARTDTCFSRKSPGLRPLGTLTRATRQGEAFKARWRASERFRQPAAARLGDSAHGGPGQGGDTLLSAIFLATRKSQFDRAVGPPPIAEVTPPCTPNPLE